MSVYKDVLEKCKKKRVRYFDALMQVKAWSVHINEFWRYYHSHFVSKNRAAKIVLTRYYSTTAIEEMARYIVR